MWRWSVALVVLLSGAAPATHHMRQHMRDLRTIERLLLDGKLAEARAVAFLVGEDLGADVARGVTALRNATTIEEAIHAEVRIATACASCHLDAQTVPAFKMPSGAPADRPTNAHQCARFQWGVDRAWEGLIGSSDEHWRAGIYVMATSALPRIAPQQAALARRFQARARRALDETTLEGRADAFAEVMSICATCHGERDTRSRAQVAP
jgi:cytochrome c553